MSGASAESSDLAYALALQAQIDAGNDEDAYFAALCANDHPQEPSHQRTCVSLEEAVTLGASICPDQLENLALICGRAADPIPQTLTAVISEINDLLPGWVQVLRSSNGLDISSGEYVFESNLRRYTFAMDLKRFLNKSGVSGQHFRQTDLMNLPLLAPLQQEFPEVIEDTIDSVGACCCKFNRKGTLLATGCIDGRCIVWDFDTRRQSRVLVGHVNAVTAVSWTRNSRSLMTASRDGTCILWDLMSGQRLKTFQFESPVMSVRMNPASNHSELFLALPQYSLPLLIRCDTQERIPLAPFLNEEVDGTATAAVFDSSGDYIYIGTSKGYLHIVKASQPENKFHHIKVTSGSSVKGIAFARNGRNVAINSHDRIIRVYNLGADHIPVSPLRFQDLVNKIQWSQCCFNSDGDYVVAGVAGKAEHKIYIWDKEMGGLIKALEGPRQGMEDLEWHPCRPIIVSLTSSQGNMFIWSIHPQENWSSFAPDFKELEENLEYEEREDEFDVDITQAPSSIRPDEVISPSFVEEVHIDILTVKTVNPFGDSDDESDEIIYLPVLRK